MKELLFTFLCIGTLVFIGCGGDDCTAEDWVGTYTLDAGTEECSDSSLSLNQTITISAASSSDSVSFDGTDVAIDGCKISALGGLITMELDGNTATAGGVCSGTYTKS